MKKRKVVLAWLAVKRKNNMGKKKMSNKEVLQYFDSVKKARQGMYVDSYNDYLQKATLGKSMGDQTCGVDAMGNAKCPRFLKKGSRFRKALSKIPWQEIGYGALGLGALGAAGYGINKAQKNKNNDINPGSGGPGFFQNFFGGGG